MWWRVARRRKERSRVPRSGPAGHASRSSCSWAKGRGRVLRSYPGRNQCPALSRSPSWPLLFGFPDSLPSCDAWRSPCCRMFSPRRVFLIACWRWQGVETGWDVSSLGGSKASGSEVRARARVVRRTIRSVVEQLLFPLPLQACWPWTALAKHVFKCQAALPRLCQHLTPQRSVETCWTALVQQDLPRPDPRLFQRITTSQLNERYERMRGCCAASWKRDSQTVLPLCCCLSQSRRHSRWQTGRRGWGSAQRP